jgi:hypothetical protein
MATIERDDTARNGTIALLLGWSGLLLGIAGAAAIILLGGNAAIATAILSALVATTALSLLPGGRDRPTAWLVTAMWTGAIGVISIFSVGMIFLIATVFLLAAFVRANW